MVSWLVRSFGIINSLAQIIFESQIVWGGRNETQFRPRNFQIWKIEYYEPLFSLLFNCFISLFPYSTNYKLITLFLVYLVLIHYLSFVVYTSENCFGSPFIKQSPQIVWSVAPPPPHTFTNQDPTLWCTNRCIWDNCKRILHILTYSHVHRYINPRFISFQRHWTPFHSITMVPSTCTWLTIRFAICFFHPPQKCWASSV